ncbi:MAG: RraA family protein [SAR202 cluster bacterium]|nr:RraA family protein [SAR202 cluster bacterium]
MHQVSKEQLDGLRSFDSATVFNAIAELTPSPKAGGGRWVPENYTSGTMRCMMPDFGCQVGFAVTTEVTTNDPDSTSVPWDSYYEVLEKAAKPIIAVMKDVDTRSGRGATFGDNMAAAHKALGVAGAVVHGTIRDLKGIREIGLPMWSHGLVPGHGVFNLVRINGPVVVSELLVQPGDLLVADQDGVTKVPEGYDVAEILEHCRKIRAYEQGLQAATRVPGFTAAKWKEARKKSYA